jgi:aspartate dehydrogenase
MTRRTRFVIGGFGNVGQAIARKVLADDRGDLEITAVAARDHDKAGKMAASLGLNVPVICAAQAPEFAPVLVEAGTYEGFRDIAEPSIRAGSHIIAVSVGALAVNLDLIDLAARYGATLHIASGALPGLDILRSAREGSIDEVTLHSTILPPSLAHEGFIKSNGIDLVRARNEAVHVFSGTAREAAGHFPRHFNVAVSLSLAGIGLDRTQVQIFADGRLAGTRHTIRVKSEVVDLEMTSQNFPSPENKRTSRVVGASILAALRELHSPLRVGS